MLAKNIRVEKRIITKESDARSKKWQVIFDGYYSDGTLYSVNSTQYTDTKSEAIEYAKRIDKYGY